MAHHDTHSTGLLRKKADNNSGWGIVALVVVITLAANAVAFTIHKNTYRHPLHPSAQIPNSQAGGH